MTTWLIALAALGIGVGAGLLTGRRRRPAEPAAEPEPGNGETESPDAPELSWVFRANRALGLWMRRSERNVITELVSPELAADVRHTVRNRLSVLAGPSEGRSGVERLEEGSLAFVAAEDLQVALLLPPGRVPAAPLRDLEALVGNIRTLQMLEAASARTPGGGETVWSVAVRLALELERLLDAEVVVAVRRPRGAQVMGASRRADPHMHRLTAAPGSTVDLVIRGEVAQPVVAYEPFGLLSHDRRNRERKAFVAPITGPSGPMAAAVVWLSGSGAPAGPVRASLEMALRRAGFLFEESLGRLELEEQAARDPLTGLANRRGLEAAMQRIETASGAVIALDLDHFKSLNDSLGHPAGDAALGFVARVILDTIRDRDTAGRIGGEEFAVWLPEASADEAGRVAERLRTRLAGRAWGWHGRPWPITASLGVAAWPAATASRDNLLTLADKALYRAKERGRNRVEVWGQDG